MFQSMDQDVVFMETCMGLRYHPHMYIECVPMEKETGDLAPIYFKVIVLHTPFFLGLHRSVELKFLKYAIIKYKPLFEYIRSIFLYYLKKQYLIFFSESYTRIRI